MKKVLIVDDSALIRKQLSKMLIETGEFEVETAKHGKDAVENVIHNDYDVITMDVNMPILDGVEATKQIMKIKPTPILMVSSLTTESADITFQALSFGAIDYIEKPTTFSIGVNSKDEILEKVRTLSKITRSWLKKRELSKNKSLIKDEKELIEKRSEAKSKTNKTSLDIEKIILIGASTGGPALIEKIVTSLPSNFEHPICIVQHMPDSLTSSFVEMLNKKSLVDVLEVKENIELKPNRVYIASGGTDIGFKRRPSDRIELYPDLSKVGNFFKPSVDELFQGVIPLMNKIEVTAFILTGIGNDGTAGAKQLKENGATVIGESEDSAIVYGMPRSAFEAKALTSQLPFDDILNKILNLK